MVTERQCILACPVDVVTEQEALRRIARYVAEGGLHQAVTLNPEFVMRARRDHAFLRVLQSADLAVPDGIGLLLAARCLGFRLPERVTGIDLVWGIAQLAAERGWRLFLLGGRPGVAGKASDALRRAYPALRIVGTHAGTPADEEADRLREYIAQAGADVLLVAYGAPAQDRWIARHGSGLGLSFAMGVGGALDFLAGEARRAPPWMQGAGLEWLYRLVHEPWRWRRMLALPAFAIQVVRAALVDRVP